MDPADFYFIPLVGSGIAIVCALRLNHHSERRAFGTFLFFGGLFGCLAYWMNLAINGSYFVLMSFVLPLLVTVGLAHILFPDPPFTNAPINKYSKGGNIVFAIGATISVVVGGLMNFYSPARQFLTELYFNLGLPS